MKLLVVEDELYAREALVRQIKKYDVTHVFEIYQAANGAEGWEICQKEDPELVLTDIRMPKMDGLQLLEQIRLDGRKTKVIILSAYSDFGYARSALSNGAFDYLLKPIDDEMLAKCLNRLMEQHRTERKEALLSGRDMATQYLLKSIRDTRLLRVCRKNGICTYVSVVPAGSHLFCGRQPECRTKYSGSGKGEVSGCTGTGVWSSISDKAEIS